MRLRLQWIPEKDQEINITLSNHRADLLVPTQRTAHERLDVEA
jgi:hypothetical protein